MARNDLRLMEAAVAVAEELNFSRASQRLRISQPALTKRIADLENRFTLTLFERDSQAETLTDAGRAFVEHARLAILHSERAVQSARAVIAKAETTLRIGKTPHGDPFLVSTLLSLRLPLYPTLRVELFSGYPVDLVHGVLSGRLDLALVTDPLESAALFMTKVAEEPSLRRTLRGKCSCGLSSIATQRSGWLFLGCFCRAVQPVVYDTIIRLASERDLQSCELNEVMVPEEAYSYIVERNGLAVLTKTAALQIARDGITIRPLAEQRLTLKTYLACRVDNESKPVSEIVRAFGRKLRAL